MAKCCEVGDERWAFIKDAELSDLELVEVLTAVQGECSSVAFVNFTKFVSCTRP
jgi:hypothetical protein